MSHHTLTVSQQMKGTVCSPLPASEFGDVIYLVKSKKVNIYSQAQSLENRGR
jgi:hypothetical protein